MDSWFSLMSVLVCTTIILILGASSCWAAPRQADLTWTCPQEAQLCFPPSDVALDECNSDKDCPIGARCCYKGCSKKCDMPSPCAKVICEQGYMCQERETPCSTPPCQLEAVCIPEAQVLCKSVECAKTDCEPGYQHATDTNGCPTCECVKVKDCGPRCFIFCADGYETDEAGCPLCKCREADSNPCSTMKCGRKKECRLVKPTKCDTAPCEPVAQCLPVLNVPFENRCSLADRTTVGLPILGSDRKTELDCYTDLCPDGTVCTAMGTDLNRCCWQTTQEKVLSAPKAGECPMEFMINFDELSIKCEIDGECPGEQKCCYQRRDVPRSLQYGFCMDPVHIVVENAPAECRRSFYTQIMFSAVGLC